MGYSYLLIFRLKFTTHFVSPTSLTNQPIPWRENSIWEANSSSAGQKIPTCGGRYRACSVPTDICQLRTSSPCGFAQLHQQVCSAYISRVCLCKIHQYTFWAYGNFLILCMRVQKASEWRSGRAGDARTFFLSSFVFLCQVKHVFYVDRRHNFFTIRSNR